MDGQSGAAGAAGTTAAAGRGRAGGCFFLRVDLDMLRLEMAPEQRDGKRQFMWRSTPISTHAP